MEYIKKNMSIIISAFLLMSPLLDLLTGVCIHSLHVNFTVGVIVRFLFLIFICFSVVFIFKKKGILPIYIGVLFYIFLYVLGNVIYKDSSIMTEVQGVFRVFYFPIMLISLYYIRDSIHISIMSLFVVLFIYLIFIFVPTFLGVGYKTYEITKVGTLGFFNSANEISGIISILTPIMFIILVLSKNKIFKILLGIMYLIVIMMMGTKTPLLCFGITVFASVIYLWRYLYRIRDYKKIVLSCFILIIGVVGMIIVIPRSNFYKNIETHLNYLKLDSVDEVFSKEKYVDHFIFSSRLKFLRNKRRIYNNSSLYERLFGIGYINNNRVTKMIEMDYFDILYSEGIIGFVVYFMIVIYVIYRVFNNIIKASYNRCMYVLSFILILLLAMFTGHIITSPSVSLLVCVIILILNKRSKRRLLFTRYDLIGDIDYSRYDVDVILDDKSCKLNENINVVGISNKLLFKIFEYENYDFSLSYGDNWYGLIGSNNNCIYIDDYSDSIYKYKWIVFKNKKMMDRFICKYKDLENRCLVINNISSVY